MILPIRHQNPPERLPVVTLALIFLNVVIYFATSDIFSIREEIVEQWALVPTNFNMVNVLTSMFLHGDLLHLLGNMWFLYLFGFAVEGRVGWWKLLILYFLAGLGGDLLHFALFFSLAPEIPSIGASGAIMGVMGAALAMFPFSKVKVFYWFGIWFYGDWIWPMWGIALYYLGSDFFFGFLGLALGGPGGVGHFAHLGGALVGFLIPLILRERRDTEEASEVKAMVDAVKDYSVLSARELEHLYHSNPSDSHLAHHWMFKSLQGQRVSPECTAAFMKHLPELKRNGDLTSVGSCLRGAQQLGVAVRSSDLLDCAIWSEKQGQPQAAMEMLKTIRLMSEASEEDRENATYRLALLLEQWFKNYIGAEELLLEHRQKWPMSQSDVSVRSHLQRLQGLAAAQRSQSRY